MRKIISVVLVLCFLFTLASCRRDKDDVSGEGIVGVWKYSPNEDVRDLVTEAITDPGVYVDLYYEFYSDGTGKTYLSTDDAEMTFSYTYDGETLVITSDDGSFETPARLEGDVLSVYDVAVDEYLEMKRQ